MPRESRTSTSELDDVVRLPRHIVVLLTMFVLLLIGGSTELVYLAITNWVATGNTHATATAQANRIATTVSAAPATVTPAPQVGLTTTTSALANPYPPHTGNLALADPLSDNSKGYRWDVGTIANGAQCTFSAGSYHVTVTRGGFFACNAEALVFGNLTYEVQMTLLRGDRGGLFFRQVASAGPYDYFSITRDGSYELDVSNGKQLTILTRGSSPAIKTGLDQPNLLAVVAQGSAIDLYVNGQHLAHLTDTTAPRGLIGVAADASAQPAEVAFRNVKVWTL
jgi:hypothetical protein